MKRSNFLKMGIVSIVGFFAFRIDTKRLYRRTHTIKRAFYIGENVDFTLPGIQRFKTDLRMDLCGEIVRFTNDGNKEYKWGATILHTEYKDGWFTDIAEIRYSSRNLFARNNTIDEGFTAYQYPPLVPGGMLS